MRTLASALLLMLAACDPGKPTVIDGSSPDTFEKSTEKARRDIPNADRLVFDRALRTIGGRRHGDNDPEQLARTTFDGMTAEQVVEDQKAREQ